MASAVEANVVVRALLVTKEPSYSGSVTFNSGSDGDAINVRALPELVVGYTHDGARPTPAGTEGKQRRSAPSGRNITGPIETEMGGSELPYGAATASNLPPLNALILASGFSGSIEGSSVIYKRNSIDQAFSAAMLLESRDTLRKAVGCYFDMTWGFEEAGAVGIAVFTAAGLTSRPTASDGTLLNDVVYPDLNPPRAVDVNLTINSNTTLKVRSANFALQRDVSTARADANAADGFAGFAVGQMDATFTVVVEADPDNFDAYKLAEDATEMAGSITIGDTAGNIYAFSFPTMTLMPVEEQDDGPIAMWQLVFDIHNSNPGNRDDVILTFS